MISRTMRISKLNEMKELLQVYLPNENGQFSKVMKGLKNGLEQTDKLYKIISNEIEICTFLDNVELKQDIIIELFNSDEADTNYKKIISIVNDLQKEFNKVRNQDIIKYTDEEVLHIYDGLDEIKFSLEELLEVEFFELIIEKLENCYNCINDMLGEEEYISPIIGGQL